MTIFFQHHLAQRAFGTNSLDTRTLRTVSWQYGDKDTMILNVDGNALTNPEKESYGGLIRKHDRSFQLGFSGSVGISNILHAEIQALLTSVKLCWDAGYKKLTCYSNSLQIVELLTKENTKFHHYAYLLELIRMSIVKDWSISIQHILWDHLITFNESLRCLTSTLLNNALDLSFSRT